MTAPPRVLAGLLVVVVLSACGSDPAPLEYTVLAGPHELPGQGDTDVDATTTSTVPATTATTQPATTSTAPAATQPQQPAQLLVDPTRLTVATEVWGDYDRGLFPHWSDFDGDGCDTRQEILIRDSDIDPALHPERVCRVVEGRWWSSYDDTWTDDPAQVHIDHLVPLAEAWESGARLWPAETREAFANAEDALVAVSASSNRAKGAFDPAEWLPPNTDIHCLYAAVWIEVKAVWGLSADQAEVAALTALAETCN